MYICWYIIVKKINNYKLLFNLYGSSCPKSIIYIRNNENINKLRFSATSGFCFKTKTINI